MHLGKALLNNEWNDIKRDLNKNPIEGIDGNSDENKILSTLAKYGIHKTQNNVEVTLWGTGSPRREFLFSEDLADACVFIMNTVDFPDLVKLSSTIPNEIRNTHINIGSGTDLTIKELALTVKKLVGFNGNLVWDSAKPDGTPQKLLDVSKLNALGWKYKVKLEEGISMVYNKYK
jgi:GDP-L-fucose synthase